MTISNTTPLATFNYLSPAFCQDSDNPSPVFSPGASAGFFTAPAGLVFINANTGEVDLGASTPDTYLVTNTISGSGTCLQAVETSSIEVVALDDASFFYDSSTYSKTNDSDPTPTITGLPGGVFSCDVDGALLINPSTGKIILSGCSLGSFAVIYTTSGICPSSSFVPIDITI